MSARLADGTDADAPTGPYGWPALMYLAYGRLPTDVDATLAVARLLLAAGADPTVRDRRFDATPAGWAEHFGRSDLAALLPPAGSG